MTDALAVELRRGVEGEVRTDGMAARSTDFGRLVRKTPRVIVRPAGERDLVHALRVARSHGIPVTLQGSAHSINGQSLSDQGILIANVRRRSEPPRPLPGGRIEVSARSRWLDVERSLHPAGQCVPVLADYLPLSVGGTLSVGGYGIDSIADGALVDQVERLRLVLPDGSALWCSREEQDELFRFALAGMGQVGAVERAVIRTRPYRPVTVLFTHRHGSLVEMVEALEDLTREGEPLPELCKGLSSRGRFLTTCGAHADSLGAALAAAPPPAWRGSAARRLICPAYRAWRSRTVAFWTARFHRRIKLWSDYVLDFAGLRALAAHAAELIDRDAFAGCLQAVYIVPIRRPPGAADLPFEAAGIRGARIKLGIGFYTMVPPRDREALLRVQAAAASCLAKCVEVGGRPYLYGWHRLDRQMLADLYGSAWTRMLELRRELDPGGVFQPDKLP